MPSSTLTSKGQLTLPRQVRDHLRVRAGDTVDFVIGPDGEVRVRSGDLDITQLKGLLRKRGRRPVSVDEMNAAIRRAHKSRR